MVTSQIVELNNITVKYPTKKEETLALEGFDLNIRQGEFVSIVGPSGCGKSTLLSVISGLITPSCGEALLKGKIITGPLPEVGYMLQQDFLFEWRTVFDNVCLGPEIMKTLNKEIKKDLMKLLEDYGLGGFANHYPNQLSGGMRQRVALIRTLAVAPEVVLLDEPFSALDYQTRLSLANEVWSILKKENKTVILVTHDISEAISMSDRVIVLTKRPGMVKNEHYLDFDRDKLSPLAIREAHSFNRYFRQIWEEIDVRV